MNQVTMMPMTAGPMTTGPMKTSVPVASNVRSYDSQYKTNSFAINYETIKNNGTIDDSGKIFLRNQYSGIVNGYQPSIIRPLDTVSVPRDLKRSSIFGDEETEKCNWPCYGASNFQQWCSKEDAVGYFAMRPLMQANVYNENLRKMFKLITAQIGSVESYLQKLGNNTDTGEINYNQQPVNLNDIKWQSVFCQNSKESIMKFIMDTVALAVSKMPEMQNNGSWRVEQFHWTDCDVYQGLTGNLDLLYNVLFNLYNPLRSISTEVLVVIHAQEISSLATATSNNNSWRSGNKNKNNSGQQTLLRIIKMELVDNQDWKSTGMKVDGIASYNDPTSIHTSNADIRNPESMALDWNYGNTLYKQEFNQFGFFEPGYNVPINVGISDKTRLHVNYFEKNSDSYLLQCASPKYTGIVPDGPNYKVADTNGTDKTVLDPYLVTYNVPLVAEEVPGMVKGPYGASSRMLMTKVNQNDPYRRPIEIIKT